MSDTEKQRVSGLPELTKKIGITLNDFYRSMKALESDGQKEGKQATLLLMSINDIEEIVAEEVKSKCVEFTEWNETNGWLHDHREQRSHTTSELFELFMSEKKQNHHE